MLKVRFRKTRLVTLLHYVSYVYCFSSLPPFQLLQQLWVTALQQMWIWLEITCFYLLPLWLFFWWAQFGWQFDLSCVSLNRPADWTQLDIAGQVTWLFSVLRHILEKKVVIGQTARKLQGNLSERDGGQTYLPERMKHELAYSSGSLGSSLHTILLKCYMEQHTDPVAILRALMLVGLQL